MSVKDAHKCRSRARINPVNFVRIEQGIRPLGVIILVKFQIFKVLGPLIHTPEPIKVKCGSSLPNFTLISATCRPCGANNPKTRPVSKTIPAGRRFAPLVGNDSCYRGPHNNT